MTTLVKGVCLKGTFLAQIIFETIVKNCIDPVLKMYEGCILVYGISNTCYCENTSHLAVRTQDNLIVRVQDMRRAETQEMRLVGSQDICLVETQDMCRVES